VPFDALSARMEVRELASNRYTADSVDVRAIDVRHPGGALGFRVTPRARPRESFVFIPDNELDPSFESTDGRTASRAEMVEFARGTKFLIHDAMYTGADYMAHRGWGHSSYRDAVEFALAAEVETLVLFHHDPERTDESLDAQLALCRSMVLERDGTLQVMAATEGTTLEI